LGNPIRGVLAITPSGVRVSAGSAGSGICAWLDNLIRSVSLAPACRNLLAPILR
jgi:hypothetical protein